MGRQVLSAGELIGDGGNRAAGGRGDRVGQRIGHPGEQERAGLRPALETACDGDDSRVILGLRRAHGSGRVLRHHASAAKPDNGDGQENFLRHESPFRTRE